MDLATGPINLCLLLPTTADCIDSGCDGGGADGVGDNVASILTFFQSSPGGTCLKLVLRIIN
jgi:hypothetical protein